MFWFNVPYQNWSSNFTSNIAFSGFKVSVTNFYSVTFYFLSFLFDQTTVVLDGCFFQTTKIITNTIEIIPEKVDASVSFCEFLEKWLHFHILSALKHHSFVTVYRLLPNLIYFYIYRFKEYFKLNKACVCYFLSNFYFLTKW